jgi:excisionase family DNA binding protein
MALFGHDVYKKRMDNHLSQKYLTARDVAELLKVEERTVRRYADRGELPGYKVMGKWRFDPEEIQRYIRSKRSQNTQEGKS